MFVRDLARCKTITAVDNSQLKEFISPLRDSLSLPYSLAHARVKAGQTTRLHSLKSAELYVILEGRGKIFIDDEERVVGKGQAVLIPPYCRQKIKNIGRKPLVFFCIVSPPWKKEDEEIRPIRRWRKNSRI